MTVKLKINIMVRGKVSVQVKINSYKISQKAVKKIQLWNFSLWVRNNSKDIISKTECQALS